MRAPAFLLLAAAGALLAACGGRADAAAVDSTFVATMVELRRHPGTTPGDSAARREALRRRGLTADSLASIAAALARDPERAAIVWRRIEQTAATTPAVPVYPTAPPPTTPPKQ